MKLDIDGYFFFKVEEDLYLMIADEDYDIVFDYIKEKGIKNIMLSEIGGCSGDNFDFLEEDYKFEKIYIFFKKPVDLSKLIYQDEIKELILGDVLFDVDLNAFPLLESLCIYGQKKEIIPFAVHNNIKYLEINQFLNEDLSFLQNCNELEYLELTNASKLTSFTGLEMGGQNLQQLALYKLPKLHSLWDNIKLPVLQKVVLENCPSLTNFSVLENAKELELLSILKGKEIDSLRFVDNLPKLKRLYIEKKMKIKDGYIPSFASLVS